jgi:F-type H+-transporting ATPase subunit b
VKALGVDLGLLVSQAVNFGVLLLVLYLALFKPVTKKLQERAERVKKGLADAEASKQLLADTEAKNRELVETGRREARDVVERATRSAEQQRQEILAQARQEAHDIILRAQQQAQREIQDGRAALQQQIVDLAIASASHVLEQNLDQDKQHQLVEDFISKVQDVNN